MKWLSAALGALFFLETAYWAVRTHYFEHRIVLLIFLALCATLTIVCALSPFFL
jgi:hypothetical protein